MMLYFEHYWDISETIEDKLSSANQSKYLLDATKKTTSPSPPSSPPTINDKNDTITTTTTTTSPLIPAASRPKLEREKSNNSISSNNSNNLISPETKPASRLPPSTVKKTYNSIPSEDPPIEYDSTENGSVLTEEQVQYF